MSNKTEWRVIVPRSGDTVRVKADRFETGSIFVSFFADNEKVAEFPSADVAGVIKVGFGDFEGLSYD